MSNVDQSLKKSMLDLMFPKNPSKLLPSVEPKPPRDAARSTMIRTLSKNFSLCFQNLDKSALLWKQVHILFG